MDQKADMGRQDNTEQYTRQKCWYTSGLTVFVEVRDKESFKAEWKEDFVYIYRELLPGVGGGGVQPEIKHEDAYLKMWKSSW